MEWVQSMNKAIEYMEEHLTEDIHCEDVAGYVHISVFHFQRMFHLLTGMAVGEYLRKRRLSLAGEELTRRDTKVIDVAYKYGYHSPESFAKAFTRFHGIAPSQVKKGNELKSFNKLVVKISLEGGTERDSRVLGRILPKGNVQKSARIFRHLCPGKRRRRGIYVWNRMRCR